MFLSPNDIVKIIETYCEGFGGIFFENPYIKKRPTDKTKKFPYRSKVNGLDLYVNLEVKGKSGEPVQRVVIHPGFKQIRNDLLLIPGVFSPYDWMAYGASLRTFPKEFNPKTNPKQPSGCGLAFDFENKNSFQQFLLVTRHISAIT